MGCVHYMCVVHMKANVFCEDGPLDNVFLVNVFGVDIFWDNVF